MEKNNLIKKGVVVAVILLFIGLAFSPSINANTDIKLPKAVQNATEDEIVEIIVTEYRSDGTIEKSAIEMPRIKAKELRKELNDVKDEEERLSIYKKYDLITQDVTCGQLRANMEEKAQRIGLIKNKLETISSVAETNLPNFLNNFVFVKNYKCSINGYVALGIRLYFGLSRITSIINGVLHYGLGLLLSIPSADLMNTGIVWGGELKTKNGTLPNNSEDFFGFMFYLIGGFVGFVISMFPIPIRRIILDWEDFFGYAAFAYAFGTPWVDPHP
jgi:hypothetical protein